MEPQCSGLFLLLELLGSTADTSNATLKDACTERNVKQSYGNLPENLNAIKTRRGKKKGHQLLAAPESGKERFFVHDLLRK